jgi:uncharacterized protein YggE
MVRTRPQRWTLLLVLATLVAGILVVSIGGRGGAARAADTVTDDSVTVLGVGTVAGVPDLLRVDFYVQVTRTSVEDALDARSRAAQALLDSLRAHDVADKDLQTTDLSLYNRHKRNDPTRYYVASESVQATLRSISDSGETIDAAASSSSHVSLGGMSFDISDDADLITEARANAYADAKKKAKQYADLSGRTLGRVERVSETARTPRVSYGAAGAASTGSSASAPIEAGRQTVRVRVQIIWQLA